MPFHSETVAILTSFDATHSVSYPFVTLLILTLLSKLLQSRLAKKFMEEKFQSTSSVMSKRRTPAIIGDLAVATQDHVQALSSSRKRNSAKQPQGKMTAPKADFRHKQGFDCTCECLDRSENLGCVVLCRRWTQLVELPESTACAR